MNGAQAAASAMVGSRTTATASSSRLVIRPARLRLGKRMTRVRLSPDGIPRAGAAVAGWPYRSFSTGGDVTSSYSWRAYHPDMWFAVLVDAGFVLLLLLLAAAVGASRGTKARRLVAADLFTLPRPHPGADIAWSTTAQASLIPIEFKTAPTTTTT